MRPPRGLQETRLRRNALRRRLAQELRREPSAKELAAAATRPDDVAQARLTDAARVGQPMEADEAPFTPEGRRLPSVPPRTISGTPASRN
ncbi:hypothetical protein SAT01_24630 [Sinomonas atrocyanea]|uniref:hypothetical protein n=1 Tax=Sinomonas atrocyanea TaxID=37927 RepID=UPI00082CDE29|nr:hypothetical protein [Sinomonas atrocyanea]GEB65015.1 hypothetical protein SAT01_24630 [Sinomonas atrocyanea]GGG61473.1 hypothetical protein GCM10007172_10660 [Sinomonas atrocyanea]